MPLIRLVVGLFVFVCFPLTIALMPLAWLVGRYPLRFWWGHRILRWAANVLMLAAAWAWVMSAWRIANNHEFSWQMVWGPFLSLALGYWLKSVQRGVLTGQLGTDPSIDVLGKLPADQGGGQHEPVAVRCPKRRPLRRWRWHGRGSCGWAFRFES